MHLHAGSLIPDVHTLWFSQIVAHTVKPVKNGHSKIDKTKI